MSTATLTPGGLYIFLYLTSTPGQRRFHWALYHHYSYHEVNTVRDTTMSYSRGYKYHIRNIGGGWIAEHSSKSGITGSAFLIGSILIGHVDLSLSEKVTTIVTQHDEVLNDIPSVTCRVWLKIVLQKLIDGDILKLAGTVAQLEEEITRIGDENEGDALNGILPRPIWTSSLVV